MNGSEIPTSHEIALIAAKMRGREASENPHEAVRDALVLWFAASDEIRKAKETIDIKAVAAWKLAQDSSPSDSAELLLGTNEDNSDAFKWINANAPKDDQFKRFKKFAAAWLKFEPRHDYAFRKDRPGHFVCTVGEARDFLRQRKQQRGSADATRQAKNRKKKKQGT